MNEKTVTYNEFHGQDNKNFTLPLAVIGNPAVCWRLLRTHFLPTQGLAGDTVHQTMCRRGPWLRV